jgi:hypothetical protein
VTQVEELLPSKCKVQSKAVSSHWSTTKNKQKQNCHRPHTFHDFIISLGHLRSCGSSLLSMESWISTMFKYCSNEERPLKAMPKSLNHYSFFFLLFFVCLVFNGQGFELRALYFPDKHPTTWTIPSAQNPDFKRKALRGFWLSIITFGLYCSYNLPFPTSHEFIAVRLVLKEAI